MRLIYWVIIGSIIMIIMVMTILICVFYHKYCKYSKDFKEQHSISQTIIPKHRVVLSFTTIPSRVKYIPNILTKLKKQAFIIDCIYVCVPYYSKRFKKSYDISHLKVDDNVKIIRCEDLGPATKLLGCVEYENDPNTIIITVDDDQDYNPSTVNTLVNYTTKYPNYAIGFSAIDSETRSIPYVQNQAVLSPSAYYLEGFGAVAYRRKFITQRMINYFKNHLTPECFLADDLVISTWLEIEGIKRLKISPETNIRETVNSIDKHNALHDLERSQTYGKCLKVLKKLENHMRNN
jgi:hypothetical protein